ncbi:PepSY domain-containing protein [Neisseria animaloris]|uniref:PepSY domain-containing protein n=1 Tax=Neisseria animaloris TaxID=326522 RepID=UPI000D300E8E|nr:PepSY domain-containing protein [Neisseria animaloris]
MKIKNKILATVMSAALLVLSGQAAAQKNSLSRIEALDQVKVSPVQALNIAQKQVKGKATEVHLKNPYGNPAYEVEVRDGQQEHSVFVDAVNGKVLGSKTKHKMKLAGSPAVSLERAIQIAHGKVGGQVLEADLDYKAGRALYEVEVLSADRVPYKVIVDAENGSVINSYVDYD